MWWASSLNLADGTLGIATTLKLAMAGGLSRAMGSDRLRVGSWDGGLNAWTVHGELSRRLPATMWGPTGSIAGQHTS